MPYSQYPIGHVLYSEHCKFPVNIITYFLYLCICLLCAVVFMNNFHSAHIFIVCNMYVIYNQVNVLPYLIMFILF